MGAGRGSPSFSRLPPCWRSGCARAGPSLIAAAGFVGARRVGRALGPMGRAPRRGLAAARPDDDRGCGPRCSAVSSPLPAVPMPCGSECSPGSRSTPPRSSCAACSDIRCRTGSTAERSTARSDTTTPRQTSARSAFASQSPSWAGRARFAGPAQARPSGLLVGTLLLTQSRAGLAVAAVAVALVAIRSRSSSMVLRIVPATIVAVFLLVPLRAVDRALVHEAPQEIRDAAARYAAWVLVAALLVAGVALLTIPSRRLRLQLVGGIAVIVVAVSAIGLAAELRSPDPFGGRLAALEDTDPNLAAAGSTRLLSLSLNGRRDAWRVAWHEGRQAPLVGQGQGTFTRAWTKERRLLDLYIVQPHSVVFEVFSELGAIGLVLFALAVAAVVFGVLRSRDRLGSAAALGALTAVLGQAVVDWTWSFPGLLVPVFLVAGAASTGVRGRPPPTVALVVGAVVVFLAVGSLVAPWQARRSVEAADVFPQTIRRSRCAGSRRRDSGIRGTRSRSRSAARCGSARGHSSLRRMTMPARPNSYGRRGSIAFGRPGRRRPPGNSPASATLASWATPATRPSITSTRRSANVPLRPCAVHRGDGRAHDGVQNCVGASGRDRRVTCRLLRIGRDRARLSKVVHQPERDQLRVDGRKLAGEHRVGRVPSSAASRFIVPPAPIIRSAFASRSQPATGRSGTSTPGSSA